MSPPAEMQGFAPGEWAGDEYFVEVAPGVDMALVVAMLVAYDEMAVAHMKKGAPVFLL